MMMPEMNGMELYVELERVAPEAAERIIFATAAACTEETRAFLDRTGRPRLQKPFDAQELVGLLEDQIRTTLALCDRRLYQRPRSWLPAHRCPLDVR
jgi:DNA-binding response OmpR family regulator